MPSKRPASAPRAPRRSSGATASRTRAPRKTVAAPPAPVAYRGRLTTDREKRELILAHANMRRARDPVQMMSVWAGVVASFAVVFIAWAWVFVPHVISAFQKPLDPGTQALLDTVDDAQQKGHAFQDQHNELKAQMEKMIANVDALSVQAEAQAQAIDGLAHAVESASSTSRTDLFSPSSTISSE